MIDWHSHVLPQMDDGSKSVDESVALLNMLSEQGVDTVIATPHFFANDESVSSFLERRARAYEKLMEGFSDGAPRILLGAEVGYYSGISRLEELTSLCIEGTDLLLLEMPFVKWTDHTVREIFEIAAQGTVTLILAHIERYIDLQGLSVFEELSRRGVLMQANANFFNRRATRRKAFNLLSKGIIQLIGSDTHSIERRPPQLLSAYNAIEKKFSDRAIIEIDGFGDSILSRLI